MKLFAPVQPSANAKRTSLKLEQEARNLFVAADQKLVEADRFKRETISEAQQVRKALDSENERLATHLASVRNEVELLEEQRKVLMIPVDLILEDVRQKKEQAETNKSEAERFKEASLKAQVESEKQSSQILRKAKETMSNASVEASKAEESRKEAEQIKQQAKSLLEQSETKMKSVLFREKDAEKIEARLKDRENGLELKHRWLEEREQHFENEKKRLASWESRLKVASRIYGIR